MKRVFMVAALLLFAAAAHGASDRTVVVLRSADLEIYREPVASFREALPGVPVVELSLGGSQDAVEGALAAIDSIDPGLVFALGTRAANACRNSAHHRPTLFAMVLNWERHSLRTEWMSGVAMEVPFGAQFFGFRLLLPGVRSLGLIYDPASTAEVFRRAAAEASEYGIEIVPRTLHAPEGNVSTALLGLEGVDAVWMIPDPVVYTESNFLAIRNWCLERRIPFFAYSENFVEEGAFASISPHYGTVGYQVAVAAARILDGEVTVGELPVAPPIGTLLVLNQAVARRIGADLAPGARGAVDRLIR